MKTFNEFIQEANKCWPGYKKKGTQKLFGKTYNRCVKAEYEPDEDAIMENWSNRYKKSIDCSNPKGFSQKAHCSARKKRKRGEPTLSKSPFNEMIDLKPHKTIEQIAKKHRLDISFVQKQLEMGIPIEHEHTKDKTLATDIALQHLDEIPDYYTRLKKMETSAKKEHSKFKDAEVSEGTLFHWFHGSSGKSKTGKKVKGWVKADGSPCANEPGETGTPKCFSSGRLAALKRKGKVGKKLIASAVRRKKLHDKNQQSKSGGEAPTYVPTFKKGKSDPNYVKAEPKLKEGMEIFEATKDKPGKGSGTKDECYHKVRARYRVWPSAYASGALVKCRKVGAANWGNSSKEVKEEYVRIQKNGNTFTVLLSWRSLPKKIQMFFPNMKYPTKQEVEFEVNKVYPGAVVLSFKPDKLDPTKPYLFSGER